MAVRCDMMAATFQVFLPRELTEEQKAKLGKTEQKVDKAEEKVEYWSNEIKKAPIGSRDEEKAKKQQAIFLNRVKEAQTQVDKLKVEFGQVPCARTDYVNVSKEVAYELVGEPLNALPILEKLTERLEREVPCCFPEESIFVNSCRELYRVGREAEINNDPSSFLFVKTSPDRRVNPSTLRVRSVLVDARSVIERKSEDTIHAVLTPLIQFFMGGLMKLLDFPWYSTTESFARNEAEPKRVRTAIENLRPDWMFFIYNLLVMRGEEKGSSSRVTIDEAAEELRQKMDTWHTLFFGELPYVFG